MMKDKQLLLKKTTTNSSPTITVGEVLSGVVTKEEQDIVIDEVFRLIQSKLSTITKKDIDNVLKKNAVYQFNNMVNITGLANLEKEVNEVGTLYFDKEEDRLRIRTKSGWKTVTLK